ncbi:hypothetical protein SH1V18_16450 [Vallitalea longa]|uniref:Peptidoglycan binding-like domain-containing protein n=1 Tax=Vallitalea longa TaxID=2936439 RepID=A0A9W5YAQ6_9FIRM|nr:peptidoglycan-binding protein [Vallitalea longa]GKX29165.1 hypothetical protein SH1V18_16450 [Vallitalea longa]
MKRNKRIICVLLVLFTVLSSSVLVNAASWPVLKRGDSGVNVESLQYLLVSKGYTKMKVDGTFGDETYRNVKGFQTARGLERDGIVGAKTWEKLIVTLKRGAKSNAVKAVQCQLGIDEDGDFGKGTESAVKVFQEGHGLKVDGIVGPTTWRYLLNY